MDDCHVYIQESLIGDISFPSNIIPEKGIKMSVYLSVRKTRYSVHTVRILLF